MKLGKLVGAAVGFCVGGPAGAAVGSQIGGCIDGDKKSSKSEVGKGIAKAALNYYTGGMGSSIIGSCF